MSVRIVSGIAVAAGVVLMSFAAHADVKQIKPEQVPAKVAAAVKAKWPKAKIRNAAINQDEGSILYNVDLVETSGKKQKKWGASLTPEGKIDEIQEPVKLSDVPKPILAALMKRYPTVKNPKVDRVTEGDGKDAKVMYEFRFGVQSRFDAEGNVLDEIEFEIELDEGKEE
jgi:hypothetical protein